MTSCHDEEISIEVATHHMSNVYPQLGKWEVCGPKIVVRSIGVRRNWSWLDIIIWVTSNVGMDKFSSSPPEAGQMRF